MSDNDDSPSAFDKAEIQKLFLKVNGGNEPLSFAFGLGQSPEACALLLHLRKSPEALKGGIKKAAPGVKKVAWGVFTVASPEVRFMPDKPVKGMIKQLRLRFREEGLGKFKPILVGPDGAEIDEEMLADDEADAADVAEAPEAAPAPGQGTTPVPDALKARLMALRPRIEAVPKDRAGPLVQALTRAVQQLRDGDAAGTEKTVGLIEAALDRLSAATSNDTGDGEVPPPPPPPPPSPPAADQSAALTRALTDAAGRIKALPAGPAQQALALEARRIQGLIASGDQSGALAALRAMAAAILAAQAPAEKSSQPAPLEVWREAKEAVDAGISQLQQALRGLGHPATTRIADFGLNGLTEGGENTRLMAALLSFDRASGEDRVKAAKALEQAVAAYRSFISSSTLLPLVEANPLNVPVDVRGRLGTALDRILAAAA